MKLSELSTLTRAEVDFVDLTANDLIGKRLLELGFVPGTPVEVKHRAPLLKDPIAVLVRGMTVALRKYEAELIVLKKPLSQEQP